MNKDEKQRNDSRRDHSRAFESRLNALHRQIADSMDHLINEECTYADVLTAPDRIQDSLRELRRLDDARYRDDPGWVRKYFPHLAEEVEKETE